MDRPNKNRIILLLVIVGASVYFQGEWNIRVTLLIIWFLTFYPSLFLFGRFSKYLISEGYDLTFLQIIVPLTMFLAAYISSDMAGNSPILNSFELGAWEDKPLATILGWMFFNGGISSGILFAVKPNKSIK